MIGKTISHYKIIDKLGEGGMGVVYKAEDTKLKRIVALKFLPPELTRDAEARERFVQEAQTASAIDHANINTIYEICQTGDGHMFISMAYCEGENLRDKVKRGIPRAPEAISLAKQIARGLARAHESNIVHRDIKTANIMVTNRGEAKILDFGLAKLAGQVGLTKTGTTVGTVAYMSPEQARGEEVDHRSDIWSLGIVLFEMLTGTRPFLGDHEQAIVYSILNEDAKPLAQYRPELPPELQRIIEKALAKSPDKRFQSADDLAADLDRVEKSLEDSGGPSPSVSRPAGARQSRRMRTILAGAFILLIAAAIVYVTQFRSPQDSGMPAAETSSGETTDAAESDKSIVVLPFEDISPSGDNEYFSDGLTDEIIADLSKVHSLRVISRTSAMALKGTDMDVKAIGDRLNVHYVLEGSVRKAGDKLKITAQLIDAAVDAHIWTEKYDGTLDDIFDMQEKVSRAIVAALKVELSADEERVIAERPLDDVQAYELYLRAREKTRQMSEEALVSALEDLERGLEIVGDNALIYAAMGYVYEQYSNIGARTFEEIKGNVEACVQKIFELEPESPHGYMLLSRMEMYKSNTDRQVEYLKKVLEGDPQNMDALVSLAFLYGLHAKVDVTRQIFEMIERNDPLQPRLPIMKGYVYFFDGRFDLAVEVLEKSQDVGTPEIPRKVLYAMAYIYTYSKQDAARVVEALEKEAPGSYFALSMRFFLEAYLGNIVNVEKIMTPDFAEATKQDFQYSIIVAGAYAALGDKEQALYWLENSVDLGFNNYIYMTQHDPFLKSLKEEERFKELMSRAKANCDRFEVLE
jgi:non-specific serine/threonine protein kinase